MPPDPPVKCSQIPDQMLSDFAGCSTTVPSFGSMLGVNWKSLQDGVYRHQGSVLDLTWSISSALVARLLPFRSVSRPVSPRPGIA